MMVLMAVTQSGTENAVLQFGTMVKDNQERRIMINI